MSGIDLSTLNDEQRKIATTLDEPLFVEAGAGSGKTFTLTRRVAWALTPGSGTDGAPFLDDLSQVLVITFTNAAAQEIRERVRSTLREAGMREQALQVDSAWISTIHGMCARILRRHAFELGLDPKFKIAEGNDAEAMQDRALEEVVGSAYRDSDASPALREAFGEYQLGRRSQGGYSGLIGVVQDVRAAARAVPDGYEGLTFPQADSASEVMARLTEEMESLAAQKLTAKAAEKVAPSLEALRSFMGLAPGRRTASAAVAALDSVTLPRRVNKEAKEQADLAKAALAEARACVLLARPRAWVEDIVGLARRVDERVAELERAAGVLSNDELVSLALRAVRDNEAIARDYAGRFRLVMVDEFQDTDATQLELIGLLAGRGARHLATVGDAQQSIYRFRGADVGVFRGRGEELPPERHVRLAVNYRSHADVLSLVDRVCGGDAGVLADFMHLDPSPGRDDRYRARDLPRIDVEVTRGVGTRGQVGAQQAQVAAAAMADRLAEYAAHGELPGDMALLLGTTTKAALYIDAIRERGLECVVTGGSTFTSAPEVATMAKLLHVLANPKDTQSGLFPLLTSEMFMLDASDLLQLGTRAQRELDAPTMRKIDRGIETMEFFHGATPSRRLAHAHDVLARARLAMRRMPVADVCLKVVRESGWLSRLEAEGATGVAREANVLAAVGYIRDLTDGMGLGPARAATEFDLWLEVSKIPPASLAGGRMESVRVMTIHASKGLEFPVTAVAECWGQRPEGGRLKTLASGRGSVCVLAPQDAIGDLDRIAETDRPSNLAEWLRHATFANDEAAAAEKTRLLYVALTRAREALIVGCNVAAKKDGMNPALACGFLDALLPGGVPAAGEHRFGYGGTEPGRLRVIDVTKVDGEFAVDSAGSLAGADGALAAEPEAVEGVADGAAASFDIYAVEDEPTAGRVDVWRPREGVFSFSSAHEQMAERFAEGEPGGGRDAAGDASRPLPVRVPTRAERAAEQEGAPVTGDEDRATNFGSAFHELAQCLVEVGEGLGDPCEATLPERRFDATCDLWRLSARNRVRLRTALDRWRTSRLRREVLSHGRVRAEVPFFSPADSEFGEYVEGAIDLLATDEGTGAALLVDYKTGDRGLSAEQVRARHEMQANFYASVLMRHGFASVDCRFVCVELADPDDPDEPYSVSYRFDADNPPRM